MPNEAQSTEISSSTRLKFTMTLAASIVMGSFLLGSGYNALTTRVEQNERRGENNQQQTKANAALLAETTKILRELKDLVETQD